MAAASEVTSLKQSSGTINFPGGRFDRLHGTTLTIDGDYSADGGTVNMNTVLQGDASAHDEIVVNGNTSGTANPCLPRCPATEARRLTASRWSRWREILTRFTKPESNRLTAGAYISMN